MTKPNRYNGLNIVDDPYTIIGHIYSQNQIIFNSTQVLNSFKPVLRGELAPALPLLLLLLPHLHSLLLCLFLGFLLCLFLGFLLRLWLGFSFGLWLGLLLLFGFGPEVGEKVTLALCLLLAVFS